MTLTGSWKFKSWLALCLLVGGAVADARADDGWLGQQVFVKETAKPKLGNKVIPWNQVGMPATVSKVEGDWLWLGKVWVRSGEVVRRDDAPSYYAKVLKRDPSAAYAYLLRGIAFRLKRDYDNALRDFTEALRIEPDAHIGYQARAAVYHQTHEFQKALADISEAIRLAPDVGLYYNDRGCIYKSLENYPKAREQFDEAVRIDPKLALAYSNRGVNWHVEKKYDKAMADFNTALEIDNKLTHAYNGRGYVWSKEGHYAEGLKDWDESIRIAPFEPGGYHNKARLYASCMSLGHRDGEMALENAQKACELSFWEEWLYVATLAAAYAELGKFDEAVEWEKKAIAMNKNPERRDTIEQQKRLELYEAGMPFRDPEVSE
jgi:tetratricopeptide (TPR) repeat protein